MFDGQVLEVFSSAGSHRFLATRLDLRTREDRKGNLVVTVSPTGGQATGFAVPADARPAFEAFMATVRPS